MADFEEKYHKYLNHGKNDEPLDAKVQDFLDRSGKVRPPISSRKQEIWSSIDQSTNESTTLWYGWAAAVALIIVSTTIYLLNFTPSEPIDHLTASGEIKEISLPDGSLVKINAMSKLSFDQKWDSRVVHLNGEAFFEVEKGETFKVLTNQGSIKVLGTSFNVKNRSDQFEVTCKSGRVQVNLENKESQVLNKGEMIRFVDGKVDLAKTEVEIIGSWLEGEFYYQEVALDKVIQELQRQFDVTIEVDFGDSLLYSGVFLNHDLNSALTMVCDPLGLKYTILDEKHVSITY